MGLADRTLQAGPSSPSTGTLAYVFDKLADRTSQAVAVADSDVRIRTTMEQAIENKNVKRN